MMLRDWAFNMKKLRLKSICHQNHVEPYRQNIARLWFSEYGIIDAFADIIFNDAKDVRNAKKKE